MSYSRQINYKGDVLLGSFSNDSLLCDIKEGITMIHGYTLAIRQIGLSDPELVNSSAKVRGVVQEGKRKIQEISKKLNTYSKRKNLTPDEEPQKKQAIRQLSKKYLEAVKNFENESKNFMKQISMKNSLMEDLENSNVIPYDEDETELFTRNSSTAYDSSKEESISVNIYDYNWGLDKYEKANNNKYVKHNNKRDSNIININDSTSNINRQYKKQKSSGKSSEFQSVNSTYAEKEKRKFKKNAHMKGDKYKDINEYLLQDELREDEIDEGNVNRENNNDNKQFVSVNTVDIENEILKQKNKEIRKLHKDIINIQELYKELSEHINIQGENLDNIDSQIVNTHQNIVMSGREIEVTRQRYARNSRCLLLILFFLSLLIIIILVVFKVI